MQYLNVDERIRELRTVDRLLTAEEVAEQLGMRTDWVWAQARAGRIPHVRLGRYCRFRASAIEAWLNELETGGAVAPPTARASPIPLRRHA
jgi:excisionase family DNA binding protein